MNRIITVISAAVCVFLAVFLHAWLRQHEAVTGPSAVPRNEFKVRQDNTYLNPGTNHMCYRRTGGRMRCWGNNTWNQIAPSQLAGIPPDSLVEQPGRFSGLSGGNGHSCAITPVGQVQCWGDASMGQMGDGVSYTNSIITAQTVPDVEGAVHIESGYDGNCVLVRDGSVHCWGVIGRSNSRLRLREFKVLRMPQRMPLPEPAIHLSFRVHHGCAVGVSGAVYCWGFNANGALGDASTVDRMAPVAVQWLPEPMMQVAAGYMHTCAIGHSRRVYCWGWNGQGQLGNGPERPSEEDRRFRPTIVAGLSDVVQLAIHSHTCALNATGQVFCWGYNEFGGAGQDNRRHPAVTRPRPVALSEPAIEVAPNEWSTCALGRSLKIYCWGSNKAKLIGERDPEPPWIPVPVAKID